MSYWTAADSYNLVQEAQIKAFWLCTLSVGSSLQKSCSLLITLLSYIVSGPGCVSDCLIMCVFGQTKSPSSTVEEGGTQTLSAQKLMEEQPLGKRAIVLFVCFFGLQTSYLTWGVLQERIMTHEYGKTESSPGEYFKNSQFLVFVNRILALMMALLSVACQRQPKHTAPLYKYSFSSFSNIMSSWFQYEALKFVSFPTQVRTGTMHRLNHVCMLCVCMCVTIKKNL